MKIVICREPGLLEQLETSIPEPESGSVLVKTISLGICGTDIHALAGNQAFFTYPRILGHEIGAVIEKTGPGVKGLQRGDKVVVMPYLSCGECVACRRSRESCCTSLSVIGVHQEGAMREFFTVPEKYALKVDPAMSPESMAVVEPFAIGRHAVVRSGLTKDDTVLIVGAGPIGLTLLDLVRLEGASVAVAETSRFRRDFIQKRYGFDIVLDPGNQDFQEDLKSALGDEWPTVVFDATGVIASMEAQLQNLAHSGTLVYVGLRKENFSLSDIEFHKRETTLLGSRCADIDDFSYVLDQIANGNIWPQKMVTHTGPFDDAINLMETWSDPAGEVIKGVILF